MGVKPIEGCPDSDRCKKEGFCLGNGMDFYRHMKRRFCPAGREGGPGMLDADDPDRVRDRFDPNSPDRKIPTE